MTVSAALHLRHLVQGHLQRLAARRHREDARPHQLAGLQDVGELRRRLRPLAHPAGPCPGDGGEGEGAGPADEVERRHLVRIVHLGDVAAQAQPLLHGDERHGPDQHLVRAGRGLTLGAGLRPLLGALVLVARRGLRLGEAGEVGEERALLAPSAGVGEPSLHERPQLPEALAVELAQCPLVAHAPVQRLQPLAERGVGERLELRVHRDVHPHPAGEHHRVAVPGDEHPADLLDVVRAHRRRRPRTEHHRRLQRGVVLAGREKAMLQHLPQHVGLPPLRPGHAGDRVDALGLLDDAGEHRRLRDAQRRGVLAEVVERRLLQAVAVVPEVDLVQVQVEDLILGQRPLHSRGEDPLADLPAQLPLLREEEVPARLLGDGGGAGQVAAGEERLDAGAHHPDVVQPLVAVEVRVLRGQEGVAHVRGERGRVDEGASLEEVLGADAPVGAGDLGDLGRSVVAQRLHRRKAPAEPDEDADHRPDQREHERTEDEEQPAEQRRSRSAARHRGGEAQGA